MLVDPLRVTTIVSPFSTVRELGKTSLGIPDRDGLHIHIVATGSHIVKVTAALRRASSPERIRRLYIPTITPRIKGRCKSCRHVFPLIALQMTARS
jgi:hypothetical protein